MSIEEQGLSRRQFMRFGAGVAAVGLAGLAACKKEDPAPTPDPMPSPEPEPTPAPTTQIITDHGGDNVEVPLAINKICDLWHAHNQIIFMLGAADKLVGTTDNFKKRKWANVVYPRLKDVEALVIGTGAGEVNYEETMKLEPDVVFASAASVVDGCRQYGLACLNVSFQDYDGLRSNVNITGKVLGGEAEKRAAEWKEYLDKNIALVEERMKDVPMDNRTRVLHIGNTTKLTTVDGLNCIVDEWIKLAGGQNALSIEGNLKEVSMEEIVKADPDLIIVPGGTKVQESIDTILTDPTWAGIKAVKNKQVYANPSGVFAWDRYSGEEALQILWAAKFFNPDKFADSDMVQEAKDFYKKFYGADMTTAQVERMLQGLDPEE